MNGVSEKKARQLGSLIVIFLSLLWLHTLLRLGHISFIQSLLVMMVFLITVFKVQWLQPLCYLWIQLGEYLGRFISPIVMGIMYLLIICPVAFILRLCGKDLLRLKQSPQAASYWIKRDEPMTQAERFRDQF